MPEHAKKQKGSALATVLSFCTPAGGRTLDTLIKSQVLYQLSYKRILVVLRVQRYALFLFPPNFFAIFFCVFSVFSGFESVQASVITILLCMDTQRYGW